MRARLAILIALAAVFGTIPLLAPVALAANGSSPPTLAQQDEEPQDTGGPEDQGASEEAGPPWTYQMARISVILLIFTFAGVGLAYWRFVVQRKRSGT